MENSALSTNKFFELSNKDHFLVCIDTRYIGGLMMLVRGLMAKAKMTIIEPSANPLDAYGRDLHFDFTALVPYQLSTILKNTPDKLSILDRMRAIIIGGAPASELLIKDTQKIKAPVYQTYGMTETASHVAFKKLNGKEPISHYTGLPGWKFNVDHRGCLTFQIPFSGGREIATNDMVHLIDEKRFIWLGRIDNIINSGGIKIHPEEVEKKIATLFRGIERNYILSGIPDQMLGEKMVIIIEGDPLPEQVESKLFSEIEALTEKYEKPRAIFYIDRFEYTTTEKIRRKETANRLLTGVRRK